MRTVQIQLSTYGDHIGNNLKDLEAFLDDPRLEGVLSSSPLISLPSDKCPSACQSSSSNSVLDPVTAELRVWKLEDDHVGKCAVLRR